jgi:hypothetical protein
MSLRMVIESNMNFLINRSNSALTRLKTQTKTAPSPNTSSVRQQYSYRMSGSQALTKIS